MAWFTAFVACILTFGVSTTVSEPEPAQVVTEKYFFAGDTFFGRGIYQKFSNPERKQTLLSAILEITKGEKMIVNLEGVVRESCDKPRNAYELCIPLNFALSLFRELNIVAVGLANNHRHDFGVEGYEEMKELLTKNEIRFFEANEVIEFPEFTIAAFTDLDNYGIPSFQPIIKKEDFDILEKTDKPLFAFIHWGSEFKTEPNLRDRTLSAWLRKKGVELIIGSHSHTASELICEEGFCQIFSLGNFIFDQPWGYVSGKLLEVEFADDGYSLETHEIPNFYTK